MYPLQTREPFKNGFMNIPNRNLRLFSLIFILMIQPGQDFAHITTAEPVWHVKMVSWSDHYFHRRWNIHFAMFELWVNILLLEWILVFYTAAIFEVHRNTCLPHEFHTKFKSSVMITFRVSFTLQMGMQIVEYIYIYIYICLLYVVSLGWIHVRAKTSHVSDHPTVIHCTICADLCAGNPRVQHSYSKCMYEQNVSIRIKRDIQRIPLFHDRHCYVMTSSWPIWIYTNIYIHRKSLI